MSIKRLEPFVWDDTLLCQHPDFLETCSYQAVHNICNGLISGKSNDKLAWLHGDLKFFTQESAAEASLKIEYYEDEQNDIDDEICSVEIVFSHFKFHDKYDNNKPSELLHEKFTDNLFERRSLEHYQNIAELIYCVDPVIDQDMRPRLPYDIEKEAKKMENIYGIKIKKHGPNIATTPQGEACQARRYRWESGTELVPNRIRGLQTKVGAYVTPVRLLQTVLKYAILPTVIAEYGKKYVYEANKYITSLESLCDDTPHEDDMSWLLTNKTTLKGHLYQTSMLTVIVDKEDEKVLLVLLDSIANRVVPECVITSLKETEIRHSTEDNNANTTLFLAATNTASVPILPKAAYRHLAVTLKRMPKTVSITANGLGEHISTKCSWYNRKDYLDICYKKETINIAYNITQYSGGYLIDHLAGLIEALADVYTSTYCISETVKAAMQEKHKKTLPRLLSDITKPVLSASEFLERAQHSVSITLPDTDPSDFDQFEYMLFHYEMHLASQGIEFKHFRQELKDEIVKQGLNIEVKDAIPGKVDDVLKETRRVKSEQDQKKESETTQDLTVTSTSEHTAFDETD